MKVLIADKFEAAGVTALRELGCAVELAPELGADGLPDGLARHDPDVLIVRSTVVTARAIAAAGRLSLIIRAGAGYDTIDVRAASDQGIFVANCPGKNAIAVAELAFALLLCCDRRVPDQTADLRAGVWNKKEYGAAAGLYGLTLGVLGQGPIAVEVMARARAFGMRVLVWSRGLTDERAAELGVARAAGRLELARASDAVSVHVAATADTANLVDAAFLAAMKPGAYLINTARGSVVDQAALAAAIAGKQLRAGLDVFADEPTGATGRFGDPIAQLPGVYGTHHVGASTAQAQNAIAMEAVRIVRGYLETGEVRHCVNRVGKSSATCLLTVRHRNRPGVLARVLDVLSEGSINVEEMQNIIYQGAQAACARIQLDTEPSPFQLEQISAASPEIFSLAVTKLGARPAEVNQAT